MHDFTFHVRGTLLMVRVVQLVGAGEVVLFRVGYLARVDREEAVLDMSAFQHRFDAMGS